jgi:hypothetical protein
LSFLAFVNHWWNLPFLVMLGLCGVFFVLQLIGFLGADSDHEHDLAGDATASDAPDADADADPDAGSDLTATWHEALSFLGVGRVPFMVVWVTLFLFAGFTGIFVNRVLFVRGNGTYAGWWFAPVLGGGLAVGVLGVRFFSRLAARLVDVGGSGAITKAGLAGKLGTVASPTLDARFGEIRVHDDRGNELLVHACLHPGEAALAHGTRVLLVSYNADTQLFWAAACPEIEDRTRT